MRDGVLKASMLRLETKRSLRLTKLTIAIFPGGTGVDDRMYHMFTAATVHIIGIAAAEALIVRAGILVRMLMAPFGKSQYSSGQRCL
jgi:hypothetical protein